MTSVNSLRQRVFISYSHEPEENSLFVRDLAKILRSSGFDPWLDEEQIPGATNFESVIRNAIREANHGLFVITKRWLERPYTRMELNLFGRHDADTHYRVAINRDGIDPLDVAAQLQQLHIIEWRVDDPQPDARIWEVYAALTRRPPGPRSEWAENGRRLIVGHDKAESSQKSAHNLLNEPSRHPDQIFKPNSCRPVLALPTGDSTVVMTDGEVCFRIGPGGNISPIEPLRAWAVATVSEGTVAATLYNRMFVRLCSKEWEYRSLEAQPLTVSGGPQGAVVGDANGAATLFSGLDSRPRLISFGQPIIELFAFDGGVFAIGAEGQLGAAFWDAAGNGFEPVVLPKHFQRPVGFFPTHDPSRVGFWSPLMLAVLETESRKMKIESVTFPDGIRNVVALGRHPGSFLVLTDTGRLHYLEPSLDFTYSILIPIEPSEVTGICRMGTNGALAWTIGGALFFVARDRTVRKIATEHVALACPDPIVTGQVLAVCWSEDQGTQVQLIRPEQTK